MEVVAAGKPLPLPPEVSVVVAACNRGQRLARCVAAVEASAGSRSFEVVAVDNCSLDDTCGALTRQSPATRVIRVAPDHGTAWALDNGLAQTGGKSLLVLDPDVVLTAGALAALLDHLHGEDGCSAVALPVVDANGRPRAAAHRALRPRSLLAVDSALASLWPGHPWRRRHLDPGVTPAPSPAGGLACRGVDVLPHGALLIRREALDVVGGFDSALVSSRFVDDWCVRARQHGCRLDALQGPEVVSEADAAPPLEVALADHRDRIRYARKHLGGRGVQCATAALFSWAALETVVAWLRSDLTLGERWARSTSALPGARRMRQQA